ncbi:MAG TPA: DNA repair protein RadA [Gammaproteobacteria bacterium]|nr:DNA repair protein RadA [Gammaproteobacteria bacterium]
MAKKSSQMFVCNQCGYQQTQWAGQCPKCKEWNALVVFKPAKLSSKSRYQGYANQSTSAPVRLKDVKESELLRKSSGMSELDQVLGGGLVPGSVVLLGGDPGIGKSTIVLQCAAHLVKNDSVLYVTGEESLEQIGSRATRLDLSLNECHMLSETDVERICEVMDDIQPFMVVIDSIQTLMTSENDSSPGSVSQVRESAQQLVRYAKSKGTTIVMIGHVTKEGVLAGPRVLEHMVDTVLYFESNASSRLRMIRSIKNRYGPVHELGIFYMDQKGLKEVKNPSKIFLNQQSMQPGSVIVSTWEGSRPMLVEIQALVSASHAEQPRRLLLGSDAHRLNMILAVMQKYLNIKWHKFDVYVNVVGGVKISETAIDLAICAAILSNHFQITLPNDWVWFAELGLGGEFRPVSYGLERIKEAKKQGFDCVFTTGVQKSKIDPAIKTVKVDHIRQLPGIITKVSSNETSVCNELD